MSLLDYCGDDDFLEIVGFEVQNNTLPVQTNFNAPTQTQKNAPSITQTIREDDEGVSGDTSCTESDDSLEGDVDLLQDELQYDVEEMCESRARNISLRRTQINEMSLQEAKNTEEPSHLNKNAHEGSSSKWPRFMTTYEGGYESDQRGSEDEGSQLSDDESDVDLPIQKRRKTAVYKMFNEKADMRNVELSIGLRFTSRKVFKEAILAYSIQKHKDLVYIKNDKKHIHVGCSMCKWELTAGPDLKDVYAWQIKSMQPIHDCLRTMNSRLITESWLSQEYLDRIMRDPLMKPAEIKSDMKARYEIVVGSRKCERAKERALNAVTTLMQRQYGILKPYLVELVKSNPGTTCVLKTLEGVSGQPKVFQRFYVCFNALKKSFLETCRPIFGLDGCFLKHACGGQLLCAVGRDGNNHMFPIAWAVVERENQRSWEWFCKLLSEDLKMEDGGGWTVISDQQKGLISAIETLWPNAEHRNCARHIYSNWSKNHKGIVLKRQFWKCVKATSKGEYEFELAQLKEISKKAYDDFNGRNPEHFCKSFFKTHSYCDVVDNNMAETFNSFILLSRYKPIVSMLEDIRMTIMDRMMKKRLLNSQFIAGVATRISLKLEESYNEQNRCECKWNGDDTQSGFEVIHNSVSHAVDIIKRTCSCRSWELTGIPCCHGMSALLYMRHQPENFLPKWYTLETYNQTYSNCLKPVPGITFWEHEGEGMVLPPDIVKSRSGGRRKKARRRDVDETSKNKTKYSRRGLPIRCSKCSEQGHDKRKCTMPTKSTQAQNCESLPSSSTRIGPTRTWNRGRKKGGKNRLGRMSNDVLSPSEYVRVTRGNKEATRVGTNEGNTCTSWLEAAAAKRAKGRGRGIGTSYRSHSPHGLGIYYGGQGEVIYKGSMTAPCIVISNPNVLDK